MSAIENPKSKTGNRLGGLFAEFAKLWPSLGYECSQREGRIKWANENLKGRKTPIATWNDLKPGEIKALIRVAREASGDGPAYRATLIAQLACDFWGSNWIDYLRADLAKRFPLTPNPQSLTPSQARAEIESLTSQIARRDGVGVEDVRKRFSPQRRRDTEKG